MSFEGVHNGLGRSLSKEILPPVTSIGITENGKPGTGVRLEITIPRGYTGTGNCPF
jgi:hypothetical protein